MVTKQKNQKKFHMAAKARMTAKIYVVILIFNF